MDRGGNIDNRFVISRSPVQIRVSAPRAPLDNKPRGADLPGEASRLHTNSRQQTGSGAWCVGFGGRPSALPTAPLDVTAGQVGTAEDSEAETNDGSRHWLTPRPEENRRVWFDADAVLAAYQSARAVAAFRAGVRR